MTHFCTFVREHAQLESCLKTPLQEIILEHHALSRLGELDTCGLLELLKHWRNSGRSALLQWDLLHDESGFRQALKVLNQLPLQHFAAIRVQDLGAANWLRKNQSDLKLHWIIEGSNHNLKGLHRWAEFLKPQLQRLVLSTEIPGCTLQRCIMELPVGCEILGLGSILMFYTPRRLLSPLIESDATEVDRVDAKVSAEDTPHRRFRSVENAHGTFLFHDRDLFLLDKFPRLRSWGLEAFRLDLRQVSMDWLTSIMVTPTDDPEQIKKLKQNWPFKTFQGFFRANRTDKALQRMKNPFRRNMNSSLVAVVLDTRKQQHLALYTQQSFSLGCLLWGVTPEGRILELPVNHLTDLHSTPLAEAQPNQMVLIPHAKFATAQTRVYAQKP